MSARVMLPLPAGCTARREAGGRKGATRWSVWAGPARDDLDGYLGDLVRWQPEGTWDWQPAGAGRPEAVEGGTLAEAGAALARAAAAPGPPEPPGGWELDEQIYRANHPEYDVN